jgi:serine protease
MKRNPALAGFLLVASLAVAHGAAPAQETESQDGRYLVQFKNFRGAAASVRAAGGTPLVELGPQSAIAAYLPAQALAGLRRNPNVALIEADPRRYPMAQTVPYGIPMVQANQVSDDSAGNTTVCIIDSGYHRNHEDLSNSANVTGTSNAGSGNWYEDTCGHGTHVAGTISALNNTLGVLGVAGNDRLRLHIEKVFNGPSCGWSYSSSLVAALNSCRSNASTPRLVVSMSLGGSTSSTVESNAFQDAYNAGVLSVAAAGNAGNKAKSYPASYPSVISVAAVDSSGNIASFSQQNNQVELAAPGVGVLSTVPFAASSVAVGSATYLGENIEGSARTTATGLLADGGLCGSAGGWNGRVVLCERGGNLSFATKVANVKNGGGAAAVIYNNVSGGFAGTLNGTSTIPAISIAREDGLAMKSGSIGQSATVNNSGGAGSGYAYYDGTSMATPHVSGVAALVWSKAPSKTNAQVRAALQATALDRGATGRDNAYGYGIVQAKQALDALGGGAPPPNSPPTASFTFACSDLTCSFTDSSTDSDGSIATWNWNFGDTFGSSDQNPTHTYAVAGTYNVALTVTDNAAASGTISTEVTVTAPPPPPPPGGIALSAAGRKVKGVNTVDLSWSGANSANIDVYRNGAKISTTANSGAYTDNTGTKGGATFRYRVCEAGTATCSAEAQVVF